ncbi:MAG: thioredoxin family protein, partial [Planctomycetota bacterium]
MSIQNRVLKSICLLFGMVALSASSLVAAEEGFIEDVNEAVELAQKENKDLLLLFTGSDWCPPCKKLEAEVFSEQDFMTEVSEHYVLVKFDFLKNTPLDEATSQRNDQWSKKFGIGSFPTIVLTDSELKPFAFAGYETGGFQNYLGLLEEARQLRVNRDEKLQAADAATGEFRAKLLDESISEMRREIIDVYYADVIAEIVELDKDNSLGLREKWNEARDAELRKVILTDILLLSRLEKPENAIQFIDEVLEEISFNNIEKLEIYQIKLNLVRQLDQNKLIDEVLDTMISLEGISGETRHRLIAKKAFLMVGSNRLPEAMKLLDQTILKEPDGLYLYLAKGELFQTQNKFQDAIKIFDLGLRNARTNP